MKVRQYFKAIWGKLPISLLNFHGKDEILDSDGKTLNYKAKIQNLLNCKTFLSKFKTVVFLNRCITWQFFKIMVWEHPISFLNLHEKLNRSTPHSITMKKILDSNRKALNCKGNGSEHPHCKKARNNFKISGWDSFLNYGAEAPHFLLESSWEA